MFSLFDPTHLVELLTVFGYIGLACIIFAESGLFFGFFLPGDSLLVTAGILAGTGVFNIWMLIAVVVIAAILGDSIGYTFGRFVGRKLFTRKSSFLFKHEHLIKAEHFYETYGPKAIVLARFMPIIRTFVPIVAGVALMRYPLFIRYNIIGGVLWGGGVTTLGYVLGSRVPNIEHYLLPGIIVIIIISFLPLVIEISNARKKK